MHPVNHDHNGGALWDAAVFIQLPNLLLPTSKKHVADYFFSRISGHIRPTRQDTPDSGGQSREQAPK
jgi:hypothetical protein